MSETTKPTRKSERTPGPRANATALTSVIGILIVLGIVIAVNVLAGFVNKRIDLTEHNIYSLSKGTKQIVRELDTPVTIRYYVTDSREMMSPAERTFARRVEDMLIEYKKLSGGMIQLQKLNPEPDTDAEDSAVLDGIQPIMSRETGNEIFMGLVVECIDKKERIPFISPQRETLLEYDITNAIARVYQDDRPGVKIMTAMNIGGGFSGNFQAPPQQPWFFFQQLDRDYDVEVIPTSTDSIDPDDTDVLIVLHPYDITEAGEYAIDQYLMAGGSVIALVDPSFFYARALTPQQQQPFGQPPAGGPAPSSDLPTLFSAWGVNYSATQVLADRQYQSQIQSGQSLTALTLSAEAMHDDSVITSQLTDMFLITPGGFTVDEPAGIEVAPLITSSEDSALVGSFDADPTDAEAAQRLRQEFKPALKPHQFAARLSGSFKSAFPDGNPNAALEDEEAEEAEEADAEAKNGDEAKDEDEKPEETEKSLKQSPEDASIIIMADVDFIYDPAYVEVFNLGGMRIPQLRNQNLSFFQNSVELLAGDPRLISIRSRASTRRPFTLLNQMLAQAERAMMGRLNQLEEERQEVSQKIQEYLDVSGAEGQEVVLPPEQMAELEKLRQREVDTRQEIRELRKQLRRRVERVEAAIKVVNIAAMPLLIIIIGLLLYGYRATRTAAR